MSILPRDDEFNLYFSSGRHITRVDLRLGKIPIPPGSIDVVFEENVVHDPPPHHAIFRNWLATPLICLTLYLYLRGLGAVNGLGVTDAGVVDELKKAGAEVVKTDRNYHRILATERLYWSFGHWGFVLMSLFGLVPWIRTVTPDIAPAIDPMIATLPAALQPVVAWGVLGLEIVVWFGGAAAIITSFFIAGTVETRNYAMTNVIQNYVSSNPDSKSGCLVIGEAHESHLRELLDGTSDIRVRDE